MLIQAGANLNATGEDYCAPLHVALESDPFDIATLLVEANADVNAVENSDRVLLHIASEKGSFEMVKLLIEAGAYVYSTDKDGLMPLHEALVNDHLEVTKLLVHSGADVDAADNSDRVPLHIVSSNGSCDLARVLVEAGANADVTDKYGKTPLHDASAKGHSEVVKLLVDAGADIQLLTRGGKSPLDYVLSTTDLQVTSTSIGRMFTLLTDAGATVNGATAKINPLVPSDVIRAIVPESTHFWLAANNDAAMLAAELAGGLDPNMKTENGMTLLHWACAGDAPECVQLLLDAGADKEAGDPKPMFYCMHESFECLQYLINYGADVNQRSEFNYRTKYTIHLALAANSPACVTALVGAGAWVTREEMESRRGIYPLGLAFNMHPVPVDALRALLAAVGERVLSEKIGGMPPLYLAVKHFTVDGVRVLVEAGADVKEKYAGKTLLEYASTSLSRPTSPSEVSRLTATVDYLKSLPCFSKEQ